MKREEVYLDLTNCSSEDLKEIAKILIDEDVWYESYFRLKMGEQCSINTHLYCDDEDSEWIGSDLEGCLYKRQRTQITIKELRDLVK